MYTVFEAWWLVEGEWLQVHVADVFNDASVLTKDQFEARYPDLPAAPFL
jgi:hypothetical protein